jgi:hypothetical protein
MARSLLRGNRRSTWSEGLQDHGSPELQAAVDAGKVKVSNAAAMAKNQTHEEQRETLEEMKAREKQRNEEIKAKRAAATAGEKKKERQSKGKSCVPKGGPLEHKEGEPDKAIAKKLDPLFAKLWQHGSDVRDLAAQIERVLIDKGVLPSSDRQRDPEGFLRKLKPMSAHAAAGE